MVGSLFHMTASEKQKALLSCQLWRTSTPSTRISGLTQPAPVIDPFAFSPLSVPSASGPPLGSPPPPPTPVWRTALPQSTAPRRGSEDRDSWQTSQKPSYVSSGVGVTCSVSRWSCSQVTHLVCSEPDRQRYNQLHKDMCAARGGQCDNILLFQRPLQIM